MNIKFNFGFTLIEMLITLTIVGVVASLSIPELVKNIEKNKSGAMLGKASTIISSGCESIIQHANNNSNNSYFENFSSITKNDLLKNNENALLLTDDNLITAGKSFFGLKELTSDYSVKTYAGANSSLFSNGTTMVNEDLGIYIGILKNNYNENNLIDSSNAIRKILYVDTNGANLPNRFGMDIFMYGLTDRCQLIPAGTNRLYALYNDAGIASDHCKDNNIENGLSCTARIIDNGFKIDY